MKDSQITGLRTIPFLLLALALFMAAYAALHAADQQIPPVGAAAPAFTLNSQEGTPVSLSDFKGKWVVLYFYPKDASPGCTIEAHGFQNDLAKYDEKKAVILGVSVDTVDSHKAFCAKDSLTFKLLSDTSHDVVSSYGSLGSMGGNTIAMRNTFIVDPKGNIAKEFIKVNPGMHSVEVLAALTELQQ